MKIVFILISMNLGGTERAILNLLEDIDLDKNKVTVMLLRKEGDLLKEIPNKVRIIELEGYEEINKKIDNISKKKIIENIKKRKIIKAIQVGRRYIVSKIKGERTGVYKEAFKDIEIKEEWDVGIAYAGPMELITYVMSEKIKAKKKYQWIHFDIDKIYFNNKFYKRHLINFEKVVCASEEGREKFLEVSKIEKEMVVVRKNNIIERKILELSNKGRGFLDNFNGVRILTIGRVEEEKGYDLAINVCKRLKEEGLIFKWYAIGEGGLKKKYEERCRELEIENYFIFLGSKMNPYRFMKECNLYIQPSRHEGYCITLAEAKLFKRKIITTNFTGAVEQLKEYENGFIVQNEEEMREKILEVIGEGV